MKLDSYKPKLNFIEKYKKASNASTGSDYDSNANVEQKNVATLMGELFKKESIGTHRLAMFNKISELYDEDLANEYIRQLDSHELYRHDETTGLLYPYCASITLYPFLFEGLTNLGGTSNAPKHLNSFSGEFINLVFAVASQFAGAISTPEYLMYMDYFIRKDYGDTYYLTPDLQVDMSNIKRTIDHVITDSFQQVVHSLNQPAAARNFQSVFWNIAYFDRNYFDGLFHDFVFPDGTVPNWESTSWLQKRFMNWFNEERLVKPLTFPVETMNLLDNGSSYVDTEYMNFTAEMYSKGHSFFTYRSGSVDSLASCCRLRNEITENQFSFTLGAGGIATGSKAVITINLNRFIQNVALNGELDNLSEKIREQVKKIHKYLIAYDAIVHESLKAKLLPVYDAGYISLEKQFLTIGINGFVEGAEFLGIEISPNDEYFDFGETVLKPIYEENKKARTKNIMFNCEYVPKMSGYKVV